jgi:Family of unknown function (DUF5677)
VPEQSPTTDPTLGAFDPAELPEIERRLEELGQALDVSGPSTPFGIVALGFGHRARSLWLGLRHASAGPSHASVQLILRALVEMTILLPWLAKDPDLYLRLWVAEGERQLLRMLENAPTHANPRLAAGLTEIGTSERIAELEQTVADARTAAMAAEVTGVGRRGPLVPSIADMVKAINTPAAREAYGIAYNVLSGFTHSGARALGMRVTSVGVLLDDGPPGDTLPDRVMGAVAHAMVLELVSEIAGLGIEGDVRALRTRMLATTPAPVESR